MTSPSKNSTSIISLINKLADLTSKKKDTTTRYSFFPIKDEESFEYYKKQESMIWSANEMDFIRDKKDYDNLEYQVHPLYLSFFLSKIDDCSTQIQSVLF